MKDKCGYKMNSVNVGEDVQDEWERGMDSSMRYWFFQHLC